MDRNRVAILTFNFNGYDHPHSHYISNTFDFITISDDCSKLTQLSDPWLKSIYVRYHPFEFTDADTVIVMDGSLVITKNIEKFLAEFNQSNNDVGVVLSHYMSLRDRIAKWRNNNRITNTEESILYSFLKTYNCIKYEGCIAGAVRIYKKTAYVDAYLKRTWNALTQNGHIIRLDEVVSTVLLDKEFPELKCMVFDNNIINGEVFHYTDHKTGKLMRLRKNYRIPKFKNNTIIPHHIGDEYNRSYEHKTEAMCLTRFFTESDLKDWLDYHLNIGFEHIHIFDNESKYNCQQICQEYGNVVSYEYISGNARHYKIFDDYINSDRCHSAWVIPIDDDEYFEINRTICNSVNECLDWYIRKFPYENMFAIRWKHLFPKIFHSDCNGHILEYCTEENPKLASMFQTIGDRGIKTIVHRYGNIHYEETEENPRGGHVPKHSISIGARFFNGDIINGCACNRIRPGNCEIEPARLIHCRYKGYSWYKNKNADIINNNLCLDNSSGNVYTSKYRFDSILNTLD